MHIIFSSHSGNHTHYEFPYIQEQQTRMCMEIRQDSWTRIERNSLWTLTPDYHQWTEIPSTSRQLFCTDVCGEVRGNKTCDELINIQAKTIRRCTKNINTKLKENFPFWSPEQEKKINEEMTRHFFSICKMETTMDLLKSTRRELSEGTFGATLGNHTHDEFPYIQEQQTRMCMEIMQDSWTQIERNSLWTLTPDYHQWTEIPSTSRKLFCTDVCGEVRGNYTCVELPNIHVKTIRIFTENINKIQAENCPFWNPEDETKISYEEMIRNFLSICEMATTMGVLKSTRRKRLEGTFGPTLVNHTHDEFPYIQEQHTKICMEIMQHSWTQLRRNSLLSLTPDHHQWTEILSTRSIFFTCYFGPDRGNNTCVEFVKIQAEINRKCSEIIEKKLMVNCSFWIPEQETISCEEMTQNLNSICELATTIALLSPTRRKRMEVTFGPARGSAEVVSGEACKLSQLEYISVNVSSICKEGFIANTSLQVEQTSPDQFRRNVHRFSHLIQRREYLVVSYYHHMLVLEISEDAMNVTEYGPPNGILNIIVAALENSWGQIHYKTITFNELFHPSASRVFIVNNEDNPNTTALTDRLRYREGERSYSVIDNNCEHYVNYLLTGNSISIQWRDASTAERFIGDLIQKIPDVVINGFVKLVLQKCLTNVQSKQVSDERSPSEEKRCENAINASTTQNTLGSNLNDIWKKCKSSIHVSDLLFAMICSLLKIVMFFLHGGHSPGRYIWEIIRIVGIETFLLLFRINRQLMEIVKKLPLWLSDVISTGDLLREMFKIGVVYLACMATVGGIFFPLDSTFFELFRHCLVTMLWSSFAGLLFDKGFIIINAVFRLLWYV
ncbi:hypothetical protein CHS0354_033419 [Potamilus streckersoni]|uniref:LRAT domain-containing protein n=1 Tax=Potamilus streckersoni TaxID=2493646 RepID=A0AAE0SUA2_9BIVA|nr:hypothetical protein CHS0354_033419 [Potamilus streckersoni]